MQKSLRFIVCFAALLLASFAMQAQAPQKFSYQAVVRNASNALVRNTPVGVRISIFQYTAGGTLKFQETHTPTTNDNGLFTIEIGGGTPGSGNIAIIDWGDGPYFLRCEVDFNNDATYDLTADQQLLAVPYALHCNEYQDLADIVTKGNHAGMKQLKDVQDPTQAQDAVTKHYLDSVVAIVSALAGARVKDTAASACVSFTWPRTSRTYNTSGIYFDTIENACGAGCDTVVALRLTIVDGPAVTLGEISSSLGTSTCAGTPATLTANVTASTGVLSYAWTRTAGATLTADNTASVTTNNLESGSNTYSVTVTATVAGCGTTNASKNITISGTTASAVTLNDITGTSAICLGGNTTLTASSSASTGTVSYAWSASPSGTAGMSATTGAAISATPTATGTHRYTVTATAHQDGCADANDSKWIDVSVEAAPAVALGTLTSSEGTSICVEHATTLALGAGTSEGTVSYVWTASPSEHSGLVTADANHIDGVTPDAAGTYVYTVSATATKSGCASANDSKTVTVTVNALPTLVLGKILSNGDGKDIDGLNTTSHTLTANITTPDPLPGSGISYQWYKNSSIMAGETNSTLDITTGGVYKVIVTYNNGTCSTSQEKEITICETPDQPVITSTSGTSPITICSGSSANLKVSDATYNGAYTYTWSPSTGLSATTGQTVTASPTSTTTYTVTASSGAGCSTYDQESDGFDITVTSLTTPSITGSTSICPDSYSTLSVSSPVDGYTYHWFKGSDEVATGEETSYNATTAGTYKVYATKDGCTSEYSNTITTSVVSFNPTLSFTSASYSGGTNSNIPVQVSVGTLDGGSNGGYTFSIVSSTASGAAINEGSYSYQKNVSATGAGTVRVRCVMEVTKSGCTKYATAEADVTITSCSVTLTSISIAETGPKCQNMPFALTATPTYSPSGATVTYQWKRGSTSGSSEPSYYSNIATTYAKAGATAKTCYIVETSAGSTGTTYWYDCAVTVSSGGCTVTKTLKDLGLSRKNILVGQSATTGTTNTASQSLSRSDTTLSFTAKTAHSYVIWSTVPPDAYAGTSTPSNLLWKYFSATSTTTGTMTVPSANGGTVYYYDSKSNSATCPRSSGTYQGTPIKTKTY